MTQLTYEQIEAAARQSGATAYTNRFVNGSAFSFGPESLRAFVSAIIAADRALREQAQPERKPMTAHQADYAADCWQGRAGGRLCQQLTAHELAGLVNEFVATGKVTP